MDIVIPLGYGSPWQNNELRYSLRSLTLNCKDADNLWLVGVKPEWLNCGHIPAVDGNIATVNIWNKVKAACENPDISDPFLFANDDYFYLKPFTCKDYPNFYGNLSGTSSYKHIVYKTMAILQQNGLTDMFFDVHRPMIIYKDLFLKCYEFFSFHMKIGLGLVMKSCYGNYAELKGVEIVDMKLAYWNEKPECYIFSIGDGCIKRPFRDWCQETFPTKSKWEI